MGRNKGGKRSLVRKREIKFIIRRHQPIPKNNWHYNEWWQRTCCLVAHPPLPTDVFQTNAPCSYWPRVARSPVFTRGVLEHDATVRAPDPGETRPTFFVAAPTSSMLPCPNSAASCQCQLRHVSYCRNVWCRRRHLKWRHGHSSQKRFQNLKPDSFVHISFTLG